MSFDIKDMLPVDIQIDYIPVYHSNSKINGIGVFTPIDIGEGDFIGVCHVFYRGYWYMTTHGNYNHSENPNCRIEVEGNITTMVAERKIIHGEELTADYREQPFLEQPKEDWVK
tara:strand:- start:42 stop:383 length:342 start_codon:yes stop_codon:yes gene_type:complete